MKTLLLILNLSFFAFSQADNCNCRIKTENKIVNGEYAKEHSLPWIVSIYNKTSGEHICGGTIMNEKYILTAAHCVDSIYGVRILVGIHNVQEKTPKDQKYKIRNFYTFNYINISIPGDIAIIELSKSIKFIDGKIEKGCFDLEKKDYPEPLLAAGWGNTQRTFEKSNYYYYNGDPEKLKQAFFKENKECENFLICIKSITEGDSTCQGDSGGPLHYTENGITKVIGVDSKSMGALVEGNKTFYCNGQSGYSRLSYYADWISEMADFDFCGSKPKTEPKYKLLKEIT